MEISNSVTEDVTVGQDVVETQVQPNEEVIAKKDYESLQSEATKWRQGQIEVAVKLVSKDMNELKEIQDVKLRDAVVKRLTPYSSFDEMVAVEGNDFTKKELETDAVLMKKVRQLEYQNEKREVDAAVEKIVSENPSLKGMEAEVKDKMGLLSPTLDIATRASLAANLVKPQTLSPEVEVFKNMSTATAISSQPQIAGKEDKKTTLDLNADILKQIQGL